MRYLSLFSGVEAASMAWEPIGFEAVAFAQYDPTHNYDNGPDFPSAVLAHRWPDVPNLGDVTAITETQIKKLGQIDLIVFGSPCQDLSIAGKRKGFDGERSSLFRSAMQIIKWAVKNNGCRFALWENVPGAFTSNEGADFCEVLSSLCGSKLKQPEKWGGAGCCFGKTGLVEWATLDAQHFGVPQRRRRVFAFADFGDWTDRQPILSQSNGLSGYIEQSGTERENVTAITGKGIKNGSHWDEPRNPHPTLNQSHNAGGIAMSNQELFSQRGGGLVPFDMTGFGQYGDGSKASTCKARDYKDATDLVVHGTQDPCVSDKAFTLGRNQGQENVLNGIRRLTPVEAERLQGMPDNHTRIPWKGKAAEECPDGPRYQAIGNSMAVPVMRWLGEQIQTIQLT